MESFDHIQQQTIISYENLHELHDEFNKNGYVIFENVIPEELLEDLRTAYDKAIKAKMQRLGIIPINADLSEHARVGRDFRPEGGNHDQNRWNMHLPSRSPFMNSAIFANNRFLPLIKKILGQDCVNIMLASDTPFPGASYQSYHQDFERLALTVNVALYDVTEHDSPLEVVPGTHRKLNKDRNLETFTKENVKYSKNDLTWAIENIPTQRLTCKAGSVIIRDQRMIHRGTAHTGTRYRPLLALWYKEFPKETKLSKISIPIPHRETANKIAKEALEYRNKGRAKNNKKLINIGSLLGRIVDETSCSDRDYRRVIPTFLWNEFTPEAKHLLRYAEVENRSSVSTQIQRHKKGDRILKRFAWVAKIWKTFV